MHGAGLLLLSAVAGYWVLERSSSHKGTLKSVGQVIGWAVVVISLVGVVCRVSAAIAGKGWCPMPGSSFCPFAWKPVEPSPAR